MRRLYWAGNLFSVFWHFQILQLSLQCLNNKQRLPVCLIVKQSSVQLCNLKWAYLWITVLSFFIFYALFYKYENRAILSCLLKLYYNFFSRGWCFKYWFSWITHFFQKIRTFAWQIKPLENTNNRINFCEIALFCYPCINVL